VRRALRELSPQAHSITARLAPDRPNAQESGSSNADRGAVLSEESGFRRCTDCGETRLLEDFSYRDQARGLRRARCRFCMRTYAREHYRRNKVRYMTADWARKCSSRGDIGREMDEYLRTHTCADCGENDPLVLEFDHKMESRNSRPSRFYGLEASAMSCSLRSPSATCVARIAISVGPPNSLVGRSCSSREKVEWP
jgi:hypothetical protein